MVMHRFRRTVMVRVRPAVVRNAVRRPLQRGGNRG